MRQGLAKRAKGAPALLSKRRTEYRVLEAGRMLNRCEAGSLMPFQWTINPYRGCELGCHYCYARYTHEYLDLDGRAFERLIFVKQFRRDLFERELRAVKPGEWIAIGTATDPYQPAERRWGVTRALLEVLARQAGLRVAVTTKSDLAARDADVMARLAQRNELRVNFTVTTLDERLARRLEPGAPRPDLRLGAARRLAGAGIETAVFASPVMPGINDGPGEMEALAREARAAGAKHFGAQMLFLREPARSVFLAFLAAEFPGLARRYGRLYRHGARADAEMREALELRVARIREELGFPGRGRCRAEGWGQLGLFDAPAAESEPRPTLVRLREAASLAAQAARGGVCRRPA
jgi:DNA repair photolyase